MAWSRCSRRRRPASSTPTCARPSTRPAPWQLVDDGALASLSETVHPAGRGRGLPLPRRPASTTRPRTPAGAACVVICADVRDPGNAGTVIRTRRRGRGAAAWCWPATASTSTTPRRSARPPAACSTCRSRSSPDAAAAVAPRAGRRAAVLAADGAGETDLFDAEATGCWTRRPPGCSATRPGGCPTELAALADHRVRDPDPRPRREPQPVDRRRGLPLRRARRRQS